MEDEIRATKARPSEPVTRTTTEVGPSELATPPTTLVDTKTTDQLHHRHPLHPKQVLRLMAS